MIIIRTEDSLEGRVDSSVTETQEYGGCQPAPGQRLRGFVYDVPPGYVLWGCVSDTLIFRQP